MVDKTTSLRGKKPLGTEKKAAHEVLPTSKKRKDASANQSKPGRKKAKSSADSGLDDSATQNDEESDTHDRWRGRLPPLLYFVEDLES
jgi:hypothetical protein